MPNDMTRRQVLAGTAAASAALVSGAARAQAVEVVQAPLEGQAMTLPPMNHRYLLSCKLSMITKKDANDADLSLVDRLRLAADAGFDGVDFDEAGDFTPRQVRDAVLASGVFVHNAINHDHWRQRFTSPDPAERAIAVANLDHCIRVSHAAGGSGVLIVVGRGSDGPEDVIVERAIQEIGKAIPLAAALGQRILFENVWSQMFYDHDAPPEQGADRWAAFVDAFDSPWVGMYHDIGNHWKYGNPGAWIQTFGPRAVKFDLKGFSRAENRFTDIGEGDLPWADVREALEAVRFTGWFTAEVGGGGLERLRAVRTQMAEALGLD